jgi:hypothetical protein
MAVLHPTEEERVALAEWFTANGIAPNTVPLHTTLSIVTTDGARSIHYQEFVLTSDGHKQVDPNDDQSEWVRDATAPCTVDPPASLNVPGSRS